MQTCGHVSMLAWQPISLVKPAHFFKERARRVSFSTQRRSNFLLEGYVHFGIAAGCCGVHGGGNCVEVQPYNWPLGVAKHDNGNLAARQTLLVLDIFIDRSRRAYRPQGSRTRSVRACAFPGTPRRRLPYRVCFPRRGIATNREAYFQNKPDTQTCGAEVRPLQWVVERRLAAGIKA